MAHLVELDAFLKQKKGLSKSEIILIADEVMEKYGGMLNFADIYVIFRKAKLGEYGELYESLSCAKVMKWFNDYADERMNIAYEMNKKKDRELYADIQSSTEKDQYGNLARIGYVINPDGSLTVSAKRLQFLEEERKEKAMRPLKERQAQIDKDNSQFLLQQCNPASKANA